MKKVLLRGFHGEMLFMPEAQYLKEVYKGDTVFFLVGTRNKYVKNSLISRIYQDDTFGCRYKRDIPQNKKQSFSVK